MQTQMPETPCLSGPRPLRLLASQAPCLSVLAVTDARDPMTLRPYASQALGLQSPPQHLTLSDPPCVRCLGVEATIASVLGLRERSESI